MKQQTKIRAMQGLLWLGTIPFVIWKVYLDNLWANFAVAGYVLTAYNVGASAATYPGPGNRWYWKAAVSGFLPHGVLLFAFAVGTLALITAKIKSPTLAYFGLATMILAVESQAQMRFIEVFIARDESHKRRHKVHHDRTEEAKD